MVTKKELRNAKKGELLRFSTRGDIYEVLEAGSFYKLENKYTGKISSFKTYTLKGGNLNYRKIEIVKFY